MSEDNDTKPSTETTSTETPASKLIMGVPRDVFVRGGTHTSAHDNEVAMYKEDVAKRRAVSDQEKELASIPIEHGGAQMFTNRMTDNPDVEKAYVLLKFLRPGSRDGGFTHECLADIVILENQELALIVVCPKCVESGMPLDNCQMRIRQSNKHWSLDLRKAGELIVFENSPYKSAGTIKDCERSKCGQCGFAFRIDDNKVYPE